MEYEKITNLLGNIPDKVPRLITNIFVKGIITFSATNKADNIRDKKEVISI